MRKIIEMLQAIINPFFIADNGTAQYYILISDTKDEIYKHMTTGHSAQNTLLNVIINELDMCLICTDEKSAAITFYWKAIEDYIRLLTYIAEDAERAAERSARQ